MEKKLKLSTGTVKKCLTRTMADRQMEAVANAIVNVWGFKVEYNPVANPNSRGRSYSFRVLSGTEEVCKGRATFYNDTKPWFDNMTYRFRDAFENGGFDVVVSPYTE